MGFEGDSDSVLEQSIAEYAENVPHTEFMRGLFKNVIAKRAEIDAIITTAAPEWPLDKIALIDRNILRMGLAELLYSDRNDVPPKVALNEAIELAKEFGGETSKNFVSGVMGSVYKDIGSPKKEEGAPRKNGEAGPMPTEKMVGAVVYAQGADQRIHLCLVHDVFGYWTLSKGTYDKALAPTDAVLQVIQSELGLAGVVEESIGKNEYIAHEPGEGKKKRLAEYFLVKVPHDELKLTSGGGLDDARWFRITDVGSLKLYDDLMPIMATAISILATK
jgi:transcription antitermination protein NusB